MFTGIISDIGTVAAIDAKGETGITLGTQYDTTHIAQGASIACDGCCLTVVETGKDFFRVQAAAETLSCTTLGSWQVGRKVNLERALKMGDELGGHLVSGHVDGLATLAFVEAVQGGEAKALWFTAPAALLRFIAAKGSVTLDGVSLTVNAVEKDRFSVMIIPHTLTATTLGLKKSGDALNLEIDLIARYVARLTAGNL